MKKTSKLAPEIMKDARLRGQEWGKRVGIQIGEELIKEGYELP
jgi:hypothetical protein